jgi:hypothetical protein
VPSGYRVNTAGCPSLQRSRVLCRPAMNGANRMSAGCKNPLSKPKSRPKETTTGVTGRFRRRADSILCEPDPRDGISLSWQSCPDRCAQGSVKGDLNRLKSTRHLFVGLSLPTDPHDLKTNTGNSGASQAPDRVSISQIATMSELLEKGLGEY